MSYTLFYAPGTASFAVHWMLVELGVEHGLERVDLKAERSAAYRALNPAGRVPTLVVDGAPVSESAALLTLLAERHGAFAPPVGGAERVRWLEAGAYLTSTLAPAMRDIFYADQDGDPADADAVRRLAQRRIEAAWERLDGWLADGRTHLAGDEATTVDFQAIMLMRWSRNMPRPATDWPHIDAYVRRLRARPGFVETCRREGLTEWLNA